MPLVESDPTIFGRIAQFEEDSITSAARILGFDGVELAALARVRANVGGPNVQDRNLSWEAMEELADAANYIPWEISRLQERNVEDTEEALGNLSRALAHVGAAFEHLRRYRMGLD